VVQLLRTVNGSGSRTAACATICSHLTAVDVMLPGHTLLGAAVSGGAVECAVQVRGPAVWLPLLRLLLLRLHLGRGLSAPDLEAAQPQAHDSQQEVLPSCTHWHQSKASMAITRGGSHGDVGSRAAC
jgi:hypothetical protein